MIKVLLQLCVIFFIALYYGICLCKLGCSMGSTRRCDCEMVFYLAFCGIHSYVFSGLFLGQKINFNL